MATRCLQRPQKFIQRASNDGFAGRIDLEANRWHSIWPNDVRYSKKFDCWNHLRSACVSPRAKPPLHSRWLTTPFIPGWRLPKQTWFFVQNEQRRRVSCRWIPPRCNEAQWARWILTCNTFLNSLQIESVKGSKTFIHGFIRADLGNYAARRDIPEEATFPPKSSANHWE